MKILFLPAWYPNRNDPMYGLFVRRHALAVKKYASVFVIAVIPDLDATSTFETTVDTEKDLVEIRVYFKKLRGRFLAKFINFYRFLLSYIAAYKVLAAAYGKPDLCHVHVLSRAGIPALWLKRFKGIPYVITEHWSRYFDFNPTYKGIIRKYFTKKIIAQSSGMSTVSLALKKAMNAHDLVHGNWKISPNSIDVHRFTPADKIADTPPIRCLHVSCFEERSKNMSGIIRAFGEALKTNPALELVMVGDGEDWQATKDLADDLGLGHKVIFTGVLESAELLKVMHSCHFSILFSHYETFAIVVAESLSCGIPVIATDIAAIPEVLPKDFGIFVPPANEESLRKAILEMADTYMNYDSEAMHQYVVEKYEAEQVGFEIFEFYKHVLK